MRLLEDRIRKDGVVKGNDVLKVDKFLNHQMDVELFTEIGKEFQRLFEGEKNRDRMCSGPVLRRAGAFCQEEQDEEYRGGRIYVEGGIIYPRAGVRHYRI